MDYQLISNGLAVDRHYTPPESLVEVSFRERLTDAVDGDVLRPFYTSHVPGDDLRTDWLMRHLDERTLHQRDDRRRTSIGWELHVQIRR